MIKPSLSDLAAFLAIAEHRSFRAAAKQLGVSPSALSHALRSLEQRLGSRLLNRTTRHVALTEVGSRLALRLHPALDTIENALSAVRDEGAKISGRIRISAPHHGARLLARALAPFQRRWPDVEIELIVDIALVDLVRDGYDAGIRLREQVPPDMVAVPITAEAAFLAAASPDYLAEHSAPTAPADLIHHRCLRQRLASGAIYRWEFIHRGFVQVIDPVGGLTSNDASVLAAAAAGGAGICFVSSHVLEDYLAAGRLVPLLADYTPPVDGLCFYYPPSRQPTRALAALVDALRSTPIRAPAP